MPVHTIDLNFMGIPGAIAAYLIPHNHGAVLIESGPGSTIPALQAGLKSHGFSERDITDVLLTHIHLDHAGAAGWLARQGAAIHVHPKGAAHLLNPEKLLASASRIYGDLMDTMWGEFLAVPEERLSIVQDGDEIEIGGVRLRAVETPGHAVHHHAYICQDTCFTGDVAGVRMQGVAHLRLPMPPPDINLSDWRASLSRLQAEQEKTGFTRIAPTHFGIFAGAGRHLAMAQAALDDTERWIENVMPANPSMDELNQQYMAWMQAQAQASELDAATAGGYEAANPSWMAAQGIARYWYKVRQPETQG